MLHPSGLSVAIDVVTWACIAPLLYARADPNDKDLFGGNLSRGFRITFCAVGVLVTIRSISTDGTQVKDTGEHENDSLYALQVALESFVTSFLTLLMPYLLQCQLQDRINIRPGENLKSWLYAILSLQVVGLLGRVFVDQRCWAIKRAGDSLSVIPVVSTAELHFRIIPGQLKTIYQTFKAMEWCYFVCTWCAVISYGVFGPDDHSFPFLGFRVACFFLPRLRLFYHGFMLNIVDELDYMRWNVSSSPPSSSSATGAADPTTTVDDKDDQVALIVRR